jgi:hypothetical protein
MIGEKNFVEAPQSKIDMAQKKLNKTFSEVDSNLEERIKKLSQNN